MQKGQPVRTVAAPGLAALLMSGNSGGIVGLIVGLGVGPGRDCAPFRLGLATLEVLPQRRAQAPLLACSLLALVRAFGPIVHGGKDTNRRGAKEGPRREGAEGGPCLRRFGPYGKDRRIRGRISSIRIRPGAAVAQW